jgi:hypothetical protein
MATVTSKEKKNGQLALNKELFQDSSESGLITDGRNSQQIISSTVQITSA